MKTARLNSSSTSTSPNSDIAGPMYVFYAGTTLHSGECGPVQDLIGNYEEGTAAIRLSRELLTETLICACLGLGCQHHQRSAWNGFITLMWRPSIASCASRMVYLVCKEREYPRLPFLWI